MRTLTAAVLGILMTAYCVADDKPTPQAPTQAEEADLTQPGPEHEAFGKMVGEYDCEVLLFIPGAPEPLREKGTATFSVIMGGRFLQQEFTCTLGGEEFTGQGLTGYDRFRKTYVGSWVDNMNTGITNTTGQFDRDTMTMIESGTMTTPQGTQKFQIVGVHKSEDEYVSTMSIIAPPAGPQKMMEIIYKRKK